MKTIRGRLIIIFIVYLSFTGGLTLFYYYNTFVIQQKFLLIEKYDNFKDNVLELRRYEKNYFMTGKAIHIEQMNYYLSRTELSFSELKIKMKKILKPSEVKKCATALKKYRYHLMIHNKPSGANIVNEELQPNGLILSSFSEKLIEKKHNRLRRVLRQMYLLPLAFCIVFILLIILVWKLSMQDILKPLKLLQSSAENAGKGFFKPIGLSLPKENEVAQCINAFNKMVVEIDTGQEQLLQSRKMASIGTFTSGIAHELNNPINNISLIVDSLLEDGETLSKGECKTLYEDLMDQAERSSGIVKNLLEFSRTDHDHFENISIKEMVQKTGRLLKNELSIKQINFHTNVQENLPKALIDKSRLQQALVNLLLNGIHAMPDGGDLFLNINFDSESQNIKIDIKDTGIGIPKEQLNLIFDPFYTTKKEGEGTGLGLSVTYNIIQRHRGKILVDSVMGQGSCFTISLPVKV
jgi:signal transduction histidine kinase